jgi:hypothetical protein
MWSRVGPGLGGQGQLRARAWRSKTAFKLGRPWVWRPGPPKRQGIAAKNNHQMGQAQGLAARASYGPGFGGQKQLSNGAGPGFGVQGQLRARVWRPKTAIKWGRPGQYILQAGGHVCWRMPHLDPLCQAINIFSLFVPPPLHSPAFFFFSIVLFHASKSTFTAMLGKAVIKDLVNEKMNF